ncbi:sugar phosphate isomerase/epimerase family protein [Polymorphospora sp. NPDC051019]|uniref:sugar phosphate isomerase/epimerase family protein n=1 Tax=Polymorphospora sp. NPDC051019 TaxID=3155725 RepID=UPI003443C394
MKLGLFTACLPTLPLEAVAGWAAGAGYEALEVAAWPAGSPHPHQANHIDVDSFSDEQARRTTELFDRHGLTLSAVSCYENNLHADDRERERIHDHMRRCVDAAAALGVGVVGTFVGRDHARPVAEDLRRAEKHLPPLVEYATSRGVRLVIENCPMEGWHPDGYPGNLAYSPELWEWMFGLGLYLNYDPSHLVWLGIDPVDALVPALESGRVLHVQAKDIEIDEQRRTRYGIFGKTVSRRFPEDVGWWRYRIPGLGQLDWARIITTLRDGGFDGVVAVEHEDPVWSGSVDRIQGGLNVAADTLRPRIHDKQN